MSFKPLKAFNIASKYLTIVSFFLFQILCVSVNKTIPQRKNTLNVLIDDCSVELCTKYNSKTRTPFCTTHSSSSLYFSRLRNHHNFHFFQNKTYFISTNHGISSSFEWCMLLQLRCHRCWRCCCFDGDVFWTINIDRSVSLIKRRQWRQREWRFERVQ